MSMWAGNRADSIRSRFEHVLTAMRRDAAADKDNISQWVDGAQFANSISSVTSHSASGDDGDFERSVKLKPVVFNSDATSSNRSGWRGAINKRALGCDSLARLKASRIIASSGA